MHTLGKVFLWLNLPLLIAAVLLTSKLVNTRGHWMKQVSDREKQIERNDEQIAQKEKELRDARHELVQQRQAWDTMLLAGNCRANPNGTVIVGLGTNQGFGVVPEGAPAPIVHVFVPQGQNGDQSVYLGPFTVTNNVGPQQAELAPLFSVQPDDIANWTPGTWRLWQVVPSQASSRVVGLTSNIFKKLEQVASRQGTLAEQQKQVARAREHLESRQKELFGDPQAPKIDESPELTEGLVAALRNAESARDTDLAELDRLRREVDQAYVQLTQIVAQNGRLVEQPSADTPGPELSAAP